MQDKDQSLHLPALESLRGTIRSSTSSMTSVPKPLKFMRPHYDALVKVFDALADGPTKVSTTTHDYALALTPPNSTYSQTSSRCSP